ncbi:MAG: AMP-binding protein, partial [Deltaproteobacteria bacterium]|nr:AMP-binding protein [Deltaproteobacteria bacterium]
MHRPGFNVKDSPVVRFLRLLPRGLAFFLVGLYAKVFLRPKFVDLRFLYAVSGPALLLANRTSLIDPLILALRSPARLTFALDETWAKTFWVSVIKSRAKVIPINRDKPVGPQGVRDALDKGEVVVLFPEALFTTHGSNMKISEEVGVFAIDADVPTLPVIFDGPQHSRFGMVRLHVKNAPRKAPIKVTIFAPRKLDFPERENEPAIARTKRAATAVYEIFHEHGFWAKDFDKNLWTALEDAAKLYGKNRVILEDADRKPMTYREIIRDSKRYAFHLESLSKPGENVGIMLPNCVYNVLSLFGLWCLGRVPVILNFTQGAVLVNAAIRTALVKTVVTSRRFAKQSGLEKLLVELNARIVYVEDFKFPFAVKWNAFRRKPTPTPHDAPGVIVFTSGSEGSPKGVQHSHRSLFSNNHQTTRHLDYSEDDVLFDPMPMFHTIGLNMLMLMPLLQGMYTFLYLSPLHAHTIPELLYELGVTMVVASDTFANAWAREGHPRDFSTLRILLCGSERIKEKTHEKFLKEFGVRIYEGYGVSEAAPVLAVSSQMNYRLGACGNFLPGIKTKLTPVDGI